MYYFASIFMAGLGGGRSASSSLFANAGFSSFLVVVIIVGFIIVKQLANRPITKQDVLVPVLGGLLLTYSCMQHANALSAMLVLTGALIGIGTGLASGQLRVERTPRPAIGTRSSIHRDTFVLFSMKGLSSAASIICL